MRYLTWWPLIAWRCSAPCHQIPPDWRMYNKWQPTAITLWCSSVIYQQHHNVMISACHQPVNGVGVYTVVARWSSWPCPLVSLHVWHRVLSFARFFRRAAPGSAGWMPEATSCGRNWSFALIFSREMSPSAGAPGAASRRGWFYWQPAVTPVMAWETSRGAPFRTEMGTFLFWAVHGGMSDRYIVGFARLVYCYYCLTDLSKLFCGTYNIDICMTIWHLLLTVFCPDKVKMMYQQHDVLMETVKMHCQKMYMMWNKVLWKKKKKKKTVAGSTAATSNLHRHLQVCIGITINHQGMVLICTGKTGSSGNSLSPVLWTKPLPEPMLSYCKLEPEETSVKY